MPDAPAPSGAPVARAVRYERRAATAVITVDSPPVNALGRAVRQGLLDTLAAATADPDAHAIVLICAGRTFIAGADIKEFATGFEPPSLDDVLTALETSAKPTIAAIHGTAFGGGLEVALACHYRIAVPSAQCGLPEVKLGLLPGAGGTQRLPRVVGAEAALDMIVTGAPVSAARARALGLLDEVVESGSLLEGALAFAERVRDARPLPRASQRTAIAAAGLFDTYRDRTRQTARGAEAPFRCIDAVEAATTLPFVEGLVREKELFVECFASPQTRALQHAFFAERRAAKIPDVPADVEARPVELVGVVGAGTMGGGIAMALANAGLGVLLVDRTEADLERGLGVIRKNYAVSVARGKLAQAEMDARLARIRTSARFEELAAADLVIEAVFEEMDLKREIFRRLDAVAKPGAILASNTSTLDVNALAAETRRAPDVLGLHFFSPANVMRLVEVVRGAATAKPVLATAMALVKRIGKVGVVVGVCDGFVGNRMLAHYGRETAYLLEEGALPEQIDRVLVAFGMPMGPCQMGDLAGLDIGWRLRKARGRPAHGRYEGTIADRLCERGRLGQKTGAGYYRYEGRAGVPDPEVTALIEQVSRELGITRRAIGDDEILERCLYPMVNEAARILEEGIALRASDVDVIWMLGYGFPAHRGGPCFYADQIGLEQVRDALAKHERVHGASHFHPAPLLERLVAEGRGFSG